MSTSETTAMKMQMTNVGEFFGDLDAGLFEQKLAVALSRVAAAAIDHDKGGTVSVDFTFKRIPGTKQVHCQHKLEFKSPTPNGTASENETRATALHVGKGGRLTLAPENQLSFLDKVGNVSMNTGASA